MSSLIKIKTEKASMPIIREGRTVCTTSWIMRAARKAMPHPLGTKGTIRLKVRAVTMISSMMNVMTDWQFKL